MPEEKEDDKLPEPRPEAASKTLRDIREKIQLEVGTDRSFIVVVAVHNDPSKNVLTRIHCRKGLPISGYLYDSKADSYYVECHDYLALGYIAACGHMTMPGIGQWRMRIPLPEMSIRRYLDQQQKADLRQFKATYKNGQFMFHFMQIIDCY